MAMTYRKDIDGLRAVAIALVVIFHFNIFSIGKAGFIGVDVFFVISGFLIGGIIFNDLTQGTFSLPAFLYRRIRRLYPAMLVTLAAYLALGYLIFLPDLFDELAVEVLASQLYAANIYFWRTVNYFGLQSDQVPLLHMWSLSLEEQYYLIFPIACALLFGLWRKGFVACLAIACLLSFALGLYASGWKPTAAFYLLPTRAWQFLAGVVLALVSLPRSPVLALSGTLGAILIATAILIHTPATQVPGWFALLPTLAALLIISEGTGHPAGPMARSLSVAPMVWLGKISYPLYLIHWPVLITMKEVLPAFDLHWRVAGVAVSMLLAWLIHVLVELPIKRGKVLSTPKSFVAMSGASSAGLIALAALVMTNNGAPWRFTPEVRELLAYQNDLPEIYQRCGYRPGTGQDLCILGNPRHPADTLIIGDSHARALAGGLDLWLQRRDKAAAFGFQHSCMPVPGFGETRCRRFSKALIDQAVHDPTIKEVILVSIWRQPYHGDGALYEGRFVPTAQVGTIFRPALIELVDRLAAAGKSVTVVDPLYAAPHDVPRTMAKNAAFGWNWSVDRPRAEYDRGFAQLFADFAAAHVRRVSLIEDLCAGGTCRGSYDGAPVFTDTTHLRLGMSAYMARILEDQMSELETAER